MQEGIKDQCGQMKKIKRVLSLLKETIDNKIIIGSESLIDVYTCIDADYAFHGNMRSHTGGAISMGHIVLHKTLLVQMLNTKISTESETVGVSEYLPYNLWIMIFLHVRGYGILNNIVYQYNQSSIRMENNGSNSSTGHSRHIHISYFSRIE